MVSGVLGVVAGVVDVFRPVVGGTDVDVDAVVDVIVVDGVVVDGHGFL